jgi:hypothetical protein
MGKDTRLTNLGSVESSTSETTRKEMIQNNIQIKPIVQVVDSQLAVRGAFRQASS